MNRNEFVRELAKEANLTIKDATEITAIMGEVLVKHLKEEGGVTAFPGATFYAAYKEPHIARNPSTGEKVNVEGKYFPKVRFTPTFKKKVNA